MENPRHSQLKHLAYLRQRLIDDWHTLIYVYRMIQADEDWYINQKKHWDSIKKNKASRAQIEKTLKEIKLEIKQLHKS